MTAELSPNGTDFAARAPTRPAGLKRKDRLRLREFDRRIASGETATDAFRAIAADPELGWHWYQRDASPGRIARRMDWWLELVAPERVRAAREAVAALAPDAVTAIGDIIRGDFGEARVWVSKRDGEEHIEIDAAAAGVRSQNARWLLERTGVVAAPGASGVTFNGPTQVNVESSILSKLRASGDGSR